jgi:hypothetical protein
VYKKCLATLAIPAITDKNTYERLWLMTVMDFQVIFTIVDKEVSGKEFDVFVLATSGHLVHGHF